MPLNEKNKFSAFISIISILSLHCTEKHRMSIIHYSSGFVNRIETQKSEKHCIRLRFNRFKNASLVFKHWVPLTTQLFQSSSIWVLFALDLSAQLLFPSFFVANIDSLHETMSSLILFTYLSYEKTKVNVLHTQRKCVHSCLCIRITKTFFP